MMERLKNMISPSTRRKKFQLAGGDTGTHTTHRLFGVALEELMSKAPANAVVPPFVKKICEFIYKHGLDNVGLFRVSGSVKVVEKMRTEFEQKGDVDLKEENDIPATAGLLKVFLRDLPDTLVPARLTQHFFSAVQDSKLNKDAVIMEIKKALSKMPEENYNLLKYISSLLVVVAEHEFDNKMSAYSLAIIFGPNIFKYELSTGMEGFKDMDSSKDVMQLFISEFKRLFAEDGEPGPKEFWGHLNPKKIPPPRPPPPKVQSLPSFSSPSLESLSPILVSSPSSSSLEPRPVPSPRKIKNIYDNNSSSSVDERSAPMFSIPLMSPRDFDHIRSQSPFALESEAHSIIESPMVTFRSNEIVDKTIVETISQFIGVTDFNQNSGLLSPRLLKSADDSEINYSIEEQPLPNVKILTEEKSNSTLLQNPKSLWEMDDDLLEERNLPEFDGVERSDILIGHKKPVGPPRRSPSRKHRRSWEPDSVSVISSCSDPNCVPNESALVHYLNSSLKPSQGNVKHKEHVAEDGQDDEIRSKNMRRNENKPLLPHSLSLQTKPESTTGQNSSNDSCLIDRSPSHGIKLFIPPLDFSTLHEHIDGTEPIPITKDRFDTQIWVSTNQLSEPDMNTAIVSPRSSKLKKLFDLPESDASVPVVYEAPMSPSAYCGSGLFRASVNTDIPPSPPVQQDMYKKYSDDDGSYVLRQITKKIQGLKKKIKIFEENFEKEHGYRPTHGEKASQPEIKKYMNELTKARKDLKRLKEETEMGNRARHNSGASSSGVEQSPSVLPTITSTLDYILKCLTDKRQESGRPEEVLLMSRDQVQEEKLAVQKALLHFEGLHGRPTSKEEKDIMRPLYDRYRSVKRMLAKPLSPRNSLELQTVPEDQMMEIPTSYTRQPIHVHVPTATVEEEDGNTQEVGTLDFGLVTRDFNVMRDMDFISYGVKGNDIARFQTDDGYLDKVIPKTEDRMDAHLHELSLSELHAEIETSRKSKKRLRRLLREFEESFLFKTGRKVMKEDRYPLQTEYSEYKKVKARLRLLEALVLKHHERKDKLY
ncbi:protein FAM13A-like isoform X2 [Biomphalaria glabrata]|uniref:Protein FAM13A-like isoform X2 n=1 Tax=Biomphalaria glabrata TaxID=6526 RepID=A0A9W2ZPE6_BIOGL|nr:protein FAM13A-like isoform X2 [Biomphalaria glabrata]